MMKKVFWAALFAAFLSAAQTAREVRPGVWSINQNGEGSTGASGDTVTAEIEPDISLSAIYNLIPANGRTFTASSGTVTVANRMFTASSSTTVGSYGTLQSFRAISYREGQGVTIRTSAKFTDPIASSWVAVGGFTIGDEVSFGYNGTAFGIWHRYGGRPEVQTLTVTGAAGGGENATVTINDVEFTIPLTASTVQTNAQEIAAYINANQSLVTAEQDDDDVVIMFLSDGDKTGAFTFSSATATASFAETTAGVTKTSTHVTQANWNGEAVPTLDPENGNEYMIRYTNGFGPIRYYIQKPDGLGYALVHTQRWPNSTTTANMENPNLHIGCYAVSTGATTATSVSVAHISSFVDGGSGLYTRNPRGFSNTKSISTTQTNILTIYNRRVYNGLTNQAEIRPLFLTLANDGTKSAIFEIRGNPTVGGTVNYQPLGTNLIAQTETAGTTSSGGRLLLTFVVAKGQSLDINLANLGIVVPPTLNFVVSGAMASGSAADLTAALTWIEDL